MMKSRYGVKLTEDEREILTGIVKRGIGSAYRIKCNKFFPFSIILTVTLEKSWWIYQMYLPDTGHFPTQKKGVNSNSKNPQSGCFTGFDFCLSPLGAPIMWKQTPVRSKTLRLLAWTGGPEECLTPHIRGDADARYMRYSGLNPGSDCHFPVPVPGFF